jgi:hypothetical protein
VVTRFNKLWLITVGVVSKMNMLHQLDGLESND